MRNPTAAFVKIGFCGLDFAQCRVRELTLGRNRCDARFLGLDYSGCVPVDVEEVVGKAVSGGQLEFADGDSAAGLMLMLSRFWISQPAAVRRPSMLARARSSGS